MSQRRTDLVLLYPGGSSSSERGVAYPVVLRNTGAGNFWDIELRALHDGEETERKSVRQLGPESETDQIFLLIPAKYCDGGKPGVGLRPRGQASAEALLDGEVVATIELPGGPEPPRVERVPRTREEEARLLQGRQDGWEYLLFSAVLLREMKALESKYRDHMIGFAVPRQGPTLNLLDANSTMRAATDEVAALVNNVDRIFSPSAQEIAFGTPDQPGDPETIEHLASRVIAIYEGLLDWATRVRGTRVVSAYERVAETVGHFADLPIDQFREFVNRAVEETDRLPALLAADGDEAVVVKLRLTLEMDEKDIQAFRTELARLEETL